MKTYSDEIIIKVLDQYKSGLGSDTLAKKYNIPRQTIQGWVKKAGIVRNRNNNWEIIKQKVDMRI